MNARLYRWHASNDFCNASKADIRERPLSLQLSARNGHSKFPRKGNALAER